MNELLSIAPVFSIFLLRHPAKTKLLLNCRDNCNITVKNETIRCPNCRTPTTIPPGGLPINYGLKGSIV